MRSFSKKLAFVLAAAMVVTVVTPAAQAKAADDFTLNRTEQTLYVNKGVNDKGVVGDGLYGNVQMYDFNLKNKPSNWKEYGYTWTSSNEKVAKVVSGGVTTAVGVGTATISCVITDKATGEIATTLTAKVTVKANAKEVIISNVAQYDDQVVEVGDVVDLNRTLVDENGNKSSSKGKYVTDITKWVAEPNKGVEINQANGQYTFTEEAVAGDYKLYCYTYQSDKYTNRTAVSEPVTVALQKEMTFEVTQNSIKEFTLNFGTAMKSLKSVTVTELLTVAGMDYEFPQVIEAPELAPDGMSATVKLYKAVNDKTNYKFTVEGCGEGIVYTASAGKPVTLLVSAKEDNPRWPFVTADQESALYCHLYDANGVEVTENYKDKYFEFTEKNYSENYTVGDKSIWFAEAGLEATVIVEFHNQEYDDYGNEVGNVKGEFTFISQPAATTAITGITAATILVDGKDTKKTSVPYGTDKGGTVKLEISIKLSTDNEPKKVSANDTQVGALGTISFEETNADIFAISRVGNADLYLFKEGSAQVIVYLTDNNGRKTAIGAVPVTVSAGRKLQSISLDKSNVTVGMVEGLDTAEFKLNLKDNYNEDFKGSYTATVEAVNKLAKDSGVELSVANGKISIAGSDFASSEQLEKGTSATFSYKVKVNSSGQNFETTFTITVKKSVANATPGYSIETTGGWGEVARTVASDQSKPAKTISFKMYELNNGVKYNELKVGKYKDSKTLTEEDEGQCFLKITKNGTDVTNNSNIVFSSSAVSGSAVTGSAVQYNEATINFSGVNEDGVVTYDLGAGTYVVTLYTVVKQGEKYNYRTLRSLTGQTTLNTGSYTKVSRNAGSAASSADADLRNCFVIKDTKNEVTKNTNYTVQTRGNESTGSLYVESITFRDEVANGVYAEYKVNIGESVQINR